MSDRFNDVGDDEALAGITVTKTPEDSGASKTSKAAQKRLNERADPPDYRDGDEAQCCGTCSYLSGTECVMYKVPVELTKVCDSWAAKAVSRQDESGKRQLSPWTPDGQPAIDAIQSDFTTNPAYGETDGPAGHSA